MVSIFLLILFTHHRSGIDNKLILFARYYVWGNSLNVNCGDGVDLNKVSICFENSLAALEHNNNVEVESLLGNAKSKLIRETIFKNGKLVKGIPYDQGKQRLIVSYNNDEIGEFYHWQTSYYRVHEYNITLNCINEALFLSGNIIGPDRLYNGCITYVSESKKFETNF